MRSRREPPRRVLSDVFIGQEDDLKDLPVLHSLRITDILIVYDASRNTRLAVECFPRAFRHHHIDLSIASITSLQDAVNKVYTTCSSNADRTVLIVDVDHTGDRALGPAMIVASYASQVHQYTFEEAWNQLIVATPNFSRVSSLHIGQSHGEGLSMESRFAKILPYPISGTLKRTNDVAIEEVSSTTKRLKSA